ncbi:MAG: radical SAM protein [Vicinamibacterales bacterium]|nr:radical SAM protein [Vicinamibacterales bacterium]
MGRSWQIPDEIAKAAGVCLEDELWAEPTRDGIFLRSDSLRKIYVEATGQCNLRCAMCPRQAWAADSGHMTEACYDSLLSGLPATAPDGVTLAFGGYGEPTVHPRFLDMVDQARQAQCRVELITNGTTMTEDLAQRLAELGVAQVTVSVDGGDDEAYAAMRGTDRTSALDAVTRLRECARRGPRRVAVGVACIATRQTVDSVPALVEMAQRLRVDFVSISNVVPHTREMAEHGLFTHAAQVSNTNPGAWRPRLVAGRFDLNATTRPLLETLLKQVRIVPPPALDRGEWHNRCRFVRDGMVAVSWDGRVAPCLSLLYTHTEHIGGRDKTVRAFDVGHVARVPLGDIWKSEPFRAFRQRLRTFDMSPCLSCGGCPISETNDGDCFGTPFPACSECLWAQGLVLCP